MQSFEESPFKMEEEMHVQTFVTEEQKGLKLMSPPEVGKNKYLRCMHHIHPDTQDIYMTYLLFFQFLSSRFEFLFFLG